MISYSQDEDWSTRNDEMNQRIRQVINDVRIPRDDRRIKIRQIRSEFGRNHQLTVTNQKTLVYLGIA